jgi:hypothetical protein
MRALHAKPGARRDSLLEDNTWFISDRREGIMRYAAGHGERSLASALAGKPGVEIHFVRCPSSRSELVVWRDWHIPELCQVAGFCRINFTCRPAPMD